MFTHLIDQLWRDVLAEHVFQAMTGQGFEKEAPGQVENADQGNRNEWPCERQYQALALPVPGGDGGNQQSGSCGAQYQPQWCEAGQQQRKEQAAKQGH